MHLYLNITFSFLFILSNMFEENSTLIYVRNCSQAGITTAYQEKPCLHPADEQCPTSAPNKKSSQVNKFSELLKITFIIKILKFILVIKSMDKFIMLVIFVLIILFSNSFISNVLFLTVFPVLIFFILCSHQILVLNSLMAASALQQNTCTGLKMFQLVVSQKINLVIQ